MQAEHFWGLVVSWMLGLMFLFPWNSILTIGDYYYAIFPVSVLKPPKISSVCDLSTIC
jgi:hypothetical protein